MKTVQLSRDSFARHTVIRVTVPKHERKGCKWCCGVGKFRYGISPDSGRDYIAPEAFCSLSCYRSYKG